MKPIDFRLYLVTDRKQVSGPGLLDAVRCSLKGGVRAVQLREKDWTDREIFETGRELRVLTRAFGAKLFINDRADLALSVDADGVHLTQSGYSAGEARSLLGESPWIGVSTHSEEEARKAEQEGADFVTLGPVFKTPSKKAYGPPIGIGLLEAVARSLTIPVLAIGGIQQENTRSVLKAGAHGIALISGILAAPDVEKAAREFAGLVEHQRSVTKNL
jgi:thiamine-phosphate pyrophosphorylase